MFVVVVDFSSTYDQNGRAMKNGKIPINDDSASDLVSSLLNDDSNLLAHKRLFRKPYKSSSISSDGSDTTFRSGMTPQLRNTALNAAQSERFRRWIEREYDTMKNNEVEQCFYLDDRSKNVRAHDQLRKSLDGSFFVRPAYDENVDPDARYFLHFVCHNEVVQVGICCDVEHRQFWFLSSFGFGSEVKRIYSGIDLMIRDKQRNLFHELQYPYKISLYKPMQSIQVPLSPLPDRVRGIPGANSILHEWASLGLVNYFNELIRISKNDSDPLREKCLSLAKRINARNSDGQTPLILAVQTSNIIFVEFLLDNGAEVNMIDSRGCSPVHHACLQANPKMLRKLIARKADPHYVNPRQTTDRIRQSNLSVFHYLALANNATSKQIERCAVILLQEGCPLMPLTREGKIPFHLAELHNNTQFDCLTKYCDRFEFNSLPWIDVASRNEAKNLLRSLTCRPSVFGRLKTRLNQFDNRDCIGHDGLFLLYRTQKNKSQLNGELGLCLYHQGEISVYLISQNCQHTIKDTAQRRNLIYKYSFISADPKPDDCPEALYKSTEELVYNYTKHQGMLPTMLKACIRKDNKEIIVIDATDVVVPSAHQSLPVDGESDPDDGEPIDIDLSSITRFNFSNISNPRLIDRNSRRLIWLVDVGLNAINSFPVIIKDYLPERNIEEYIAYRCDELKTARQMDERHFEYAARTLLEFQHESNLLLNELKIHPFIVRSFQCEPLIKQEYRLFFECLPLGNLQSYLKKINVNLFDPWGDPCHWIYQLAQVMAFLTQKKIVHRDLAARNILLRNAQHIKLTDFGLSRPEGQVPESTDRTLPFRWTAPECFQSDYKLHPSADVWSFGVVIWEIYSFGSLPYEKEISQDSPQLIRRLKQFLTQENHRLARPEHCPESIYDLIYSCWNINVHQRPKFYDIIEDLNGTTLIKERKAWQRAMKKYTALYKITPILRPVNDHYLTVNDEEENEEVF